jgi:hypothetical protein
MVVEMDAGGAFPVGYSHQMVTQLIQDSSLEAVFSNRFFHSGRLHNIYNHSTGRIATSLIGTVLSNLLLPLGRIVPDMTSGLSVVRSGVARHIFETYGSSEEFVSVSIGPGHFFQTEWRSLILWNTDKVLFHNIKMGEFKERKPASLGTGSLLRAFRALLKLRAKRAA